MRVLLPADREALDRRAQRLRGADPLGAPRTRAGVADRVRAPRRGDRPHRAARLVGARGGVPPARALARGVARERAAHDEREPVAAPAARARPARRRGARAPRHRRGTRRGVARDHREHPDARRRVGRRRARRAARARRAPLGRRLRLRLLVARLPAAAPGRGAEDRPHLRRRGRARHRAAPRSSRRSWAWRARSGWRRWPRASRPATSCAACAPPGASMGQGYLFGRPQPADTFGDRPVQVVRPRKRTADGESARPPRPAPERAVARDAPTVDRS